MENLNVDALNDIVDQLGAEGNRIKDVMDSVGAQDRSAFSPEDALKALKPMVQQLGGLEKLSELSEKLNRMAETYKTLSPEDKKAFEENAKSTITDKLMKVKQIAESLANKNLQSDGASSASGHIEQYGYATIILCVIAVFIIFAFFGYKLYKSLKDREVKREEKKKQKQLRKKK